MMHRILSLTNVPRSNLQCLYIGSSNLTKEIQVRTVYCTYCGNIRKNFRIKGVTRSQSTKAALVRKSQIKNEKSKDPHKYVELLQVNATNTTETKASVSKFKAKHFSRLIASDNMPSNDYCKLNNSLFDAKSDWKIDNEVHKEIENVVLSKYKRSGVYELTEDDCAIIFASHASPPNVLFKTSERLKSIRDSYDKFRKETVKRQKMKDIVIAINEGLNQSGNVATTAGTTDTTQIKTRLENFKHLLSAVNDSPDPHLGSIFQHLEKKRVHLPNNLSDSINNQEVCGTSTKQASSPNVPTKVQTKKKEKISSKELSVRQAKEFQTKAKELSLNKLLECHLSVSVYSGNLDKAYQLFKYFRRRGLKHDNHPKLNNINLINILLRGYAAKADYSTVKNILDIAKLDGLSLNTESYSAIFECLHRSQVLDKQSLLRDYMESMNSSGLHLNDLLDKCHNSVEQANHVLSAIQSINPKFVPKYSSKPLAYDCELVDSLNPGKSSGMEIYRSPAEGLFTHDALMKEALVQIENEERGTINIGNIMNTDSPSAAVLHYRKILEAWEKESRKNLHKAFTYNLFALKSQANASHNPLNIIPYLSLLKVEDFVDIMMVHIMKLASGSETFSPTARCLQKDLGRAVNMQYKIVKKKDYGMNDKILRIYSDYTKWYLERDGDLCSEKYNSRRAWQYFVDKHADGTSLTTGDLSWPTSVCVCVGQFLHNIIMNDIYINANVFKKKTEKKLVPALYSVFRVHGYRKTNEIKPHPLLVKLVTESARPTLIMETPLVPSLSPPLPWTSPVNGGYLISETTVVRLLLGSVSQLKILEAAPPQTLYPCLDSLNQLGSIPWKVNKPILDLMIEIFRKGGSREFDIAAPSSSLLPTLPIKEQLTKKQKSLAHRLKVQLTRQKKEMHSLWCDLLYKLSLANHHRDKIFWLPHNLDFRGRTYPCPPHLSHLGSDKTRAIMIFAKGMPLGPNGLKWLKIQCINLTGTMKKNTLEERLAFVEQNMDKILDSADNPLHGDKWWVHSDDPWQTLACCMEIANAIRSPNHEEYVCHVPIHQDGSCNGLQHYAALGRDEAGAFSVNLSPADRPQDVYSAVVNLVEESRARDARDGVPIANILEGFIKRKVIKQTIMTTVYGVTKFGARLQIAKQLKDIEDFPKEHIWAASFYLTKKTFESLTEMFTSTKQIQDWFTELARLMSSVHSEKMEWITPLGLPIIQPYHKPSKTVYNSKNTLMEYASYDETEKPCTMKQKNAFPPNFIHSLDATHMMLTSLHCEANNMTFVSVHDCFWTHAASVELMNKICRQQFVALHSQPILEDLSEHLIQKYTSMANQSGSKNNSHQALLQLLKALPKRGQFDLNNVLKSTYFFS